jgi:protein-disulfide isomerase
MIKKLDLTSLALGAATGLALFGLGFFAWSSAWSSDKSQTEFGDEQVDAIEQVIFDYLMEKPEVIIQAVEVLQAREEAAEQDRIAQAMTDKKDAIYSAPASMVLGNPDGDLTIVEFFDYQCGYCKKGLPEVMAMVESDKNVRLVLKEYPVLGAASVMASRAAIASIEQDKYPEFHLALMKSTGKLTAARIDEIATDVGLNVKKLHKDMDDASITSMLAGNKAVASALGVTGTPSFVIGDELYQGLMNRDQLAAVAAKVRSQASQPTAMN